MPFRSLKKADLRPLSSNTRRTIPRFALALTLAAQVAVWGTLVVVAFVLLRPFQTAAEELEWALSPPAMLLIQLAELARVQVGWLLAALTALLAAESYWFASHRPFEIRRGLWQAWILGSLVLPFLLLLGGGLLVLQTWAEMLGSLG